MRAMVFYHAGRPLRETDWPLPDPGKRQVLLRVRACAVCRTDLHVVDGELPNPKTPLVPGHEIVGLVESNGEEADLFEEGDRVGVPWLGWACGTCHYCRSRAENLCDQALFTGYTLDGGYAQYTVADERFCIPLPPSYPDIELAPFLCAGLIGHRCLKKTGDGKRLGLYGFGAAAHIIAQVAYYEGREVYAFTRPGDQKAQAFALELGACWAGGSDQPAPVELDGAIIFAPIGDLVPRALEAVRKGGRVVCGGIHMSDIPSFPYELLWGERELVSVANLTRQDGEDFFKIVPRMPIHTRVQPFALSQANAALTCLREGRIEGAAVLDMDKRAASEEGSC